MTQPSVVLHICTCRDNRGGGWDNNRGGGGGGGGGNYNNFQGNNYQGGGGRGRGGYDNDRGGGGGRGGQGRGGQAEAKPQDVIYHDIKEERPMWILSCYRWRCLMKCSWFTSPTTSCWPFQAPAHIPFCLFADHGLHLRLPPAAPLLNPLGLISACST